MAIKKDTVTIDGTKYEIKRLGALEGRRVLVRLMQVAGPALGALAESEAKGGIEAISLAVAKLAESMNAETFAYLCDTFIEQTRVYTAEDTAPNMTKQMFDEHFSGNYLAMLKWLAAHLKFNFADFLENSVGMTLRNAMVASVLKSQTT